MMDAWMTTMGRRQTMGLCAFAALLALPLGCGGGAAKSTVADMTDDQKAVSALVGGVSDYSTELARLREVFTKDGAPSSADRKKYADNGFEIDGDINVAGSSATVQVKIMNYATGDTRSATWKLVKEGDKWLLSEAPVP